MWGDERISKLVEPVVTALGYELVGVERLSIGKGVLLRIYIDTPLGVTVDDCERVSHQISALLDVEEPVASPYTLEISSPGLNRPLFTEEHFKRFAGAEVSITLSEPLNGRRRFKGLLRGVRGNGVMILVEGEEFELPLERIKKAQLIPEL
ncbi:ribosome maturation factor RimP [Nitrosococcus wardiae]|uniref:Ribosome maturation factor RimP n=1 Tax=Nitrosococcus wardiae TaxID=1814290 RepID=A0A4P7BY78_9GAMM|nr:ribosome maturation factor RimP [Nitrosococcus wardiae]QBQ55011.1 ribosome maturation factor RimP [Nitrosococcus wardiae]